MKIQSTVSAAKTLQVVANFDHAHINREPHRVLNKFFELCYNLFRILSSRQQISNCVVLANTCTYFKSTSARAAIYHMLRAHAPKNGSLALPAFNTSTMVSLSHLTNTLVPDQKRANDTTILTIYRCTHVEVCKTMYYGEVIHKIIPLTPSPVRHASSSKIKLISHEHIWKHIIHRQELIKAL